MKTKYIKLTTLLRLSAMLLLPLTLKADELESGERADWMRGAWGLFWGPSQFVNGLGDDLSIDPFLEQIQDLKTLDYIQIRLSGSYVNSSCHLAPHPILESLWQGDRDENGNPINLIVPTPGSGKDPFLDQLIAIKNAGLKTQVYINASQMLQRWRRFSWGDVRLDNPENIPNISERWKEYCDTTPEVQEFIESRDYHIAEVDRGLPEDQHAYPERKYMFCYAEFLLKDFAIRYGDLIDAWIVDSGVMMYSYNGDSLYSGEAEDQKIYEALTMAVRAGNPDAAISFNNGINYGVNPFAASSRFDDYTFGHPFNSGKFIGSKDVEIDTDGTPFTRYDRNYSSISWMKHTNGLVHNNGGWGNLGYQGGHEWTWDDKIVGHLYFPMAQTRWNSAAFLNALSNDEFVMWTEEVVNSGAAITWGAPLFDADVHLGTDYTMADWGLEQLKLADQAILDRGNLSGKPSWARAETVMAPMIRGSFYYQELRSGVDFWAPDGEDVDLKILGKGFPNWLKLERSEQDLNVWIISGHVPAKALRQTFNLSADTATQSAEREINLSVQGIVDFPESVDGAPVWIEQKIYFEDVEVGQVDIHDLVLGRDYFDYESDSLVINKKWGPDWITIEQKDEGAWYLKCAPQVDDLGLNRVRLRLHDGQNVSLTTVYVNVVSNQTVEIKPEISEMNSEEETVTAISAWTQAADGVAIYRVAFDLVPTSGDSIVSAPPTFSYGDEDSSYTEINWGLGEDAKLSGTESIKIENPRIVNFRNRGSSLRAEDVKVSIDKLTILNANKPSGANSLLLTTPEGEEYSYQHVQEHPRTLKLENALDSNEVNSIQLTVGDTEVEEINEWSLESVSLKVEFAKE